MNLIQTLYINSGKDPLRDSFGWAAPEYHIMGWALSCLQLHKLYGNVTLYANSPAARLLIDTLQLPYTNVNLAPDELTLIHPNLWVLSKIYTYSLQEEPFLNIDGDVFLFERFNPNLPAGELIAQNVEVATEHFYTAVQKELMRNLTFFPDCVKTDFESGIPIQACNAGILGGRNIPFFQEYSKTAFEYVNKNADRLNRISVNMFNVFVEQHLFYALSKAKGLKVSVLFEEIINDRGYRHLGDFHETPFNLKYLHLLGEFKRDEYTCIQMAARLRQLYPDYYDRTVALFRENNIRLSPGGFLNKTGSLSNKTDEKNNIHLQRLKFASKQCPPEIKKKSFQNDFEKFYRQLLSFISCHNGPDPQSPKYLNERDSFSHLRYQYLFADISVISDKTVVRCPKTEIIESSFNWAGLLNKYYREVGYYKELKINKGRFYNLAVPENTDNGFSLYDIDQIENIIFKLLSEPLSVGELLLKMQIHFEDSVLQNHKEAYKNLIFSSIKQLAAKKAIHPLLYEPKINSLHNNNIF